MTMEHGGRRRNNVLLHVTRARAVGPLPAGVGSGQAGGGREEKQEKRGREAGIVECDNENENPFPVDF